MPGDRVVAEHRSDCGGLGSDIFQQADRTGLLQGLAQRQNAPHARLHLFILNQGQAVLKAVLPLEVLKGIVVDGVADRTLRLQRAHSALLQILQAGPEGGQILLVALAVERVNLHQLHGHGCGDDRGVAGIEPDVGVVLPVAVAGVVVC